MLPPDVSAAHPSPSHGKANIRRVELPQVLGKVEEYGEFREALCPSVDEPYTAYMLPQTPATAQACRVTGDSW